VVNGRKWKPYGSGNDTLGPERTCVTDPEQRQVLGWDIAVQCCWPEATEPWKMCDRQSNIDGCLSGGATSGNPALPMGGSTWSEADARCRSVQLKLCTHDGPVNWVGTPLGANSTPPACGGGGCVASPRLRPFA
tara:strand:+ start:60 stop:461 length:402 start_codon:yes stop_codon:yes gene_type:complete